MSNFKSRLERCVIKVRGDETLFRVTNDQIHCNLQEYAIIPLEEYNALVARVKNKEAK